MNERVEALRKLLEETIAASVAAAVALPVDPKNTTYYIETGRRIQALEALKNHLP